MTDPIPTPRPGAWTFLSNHGHVLMALSRDPGARVRDVASAAATVRTNIVKT